MAEYKWRRKRRKGPGREEMMTGSHKRVRWGLQSTQIIMLITIIS